jgi:hypothetical protein
MNTSNPVPRSVKIIRWTARIWSLLANTFALMIFFLPDDSSSSPPIEAVDKFMLSLTALAMLSLFIAWRWEFVGGIVTIVMLFVREIAWVILKGNWLVGFLVLWLFFLPPAILFLIAWRQDRKSKKL